MNPLLSRDFSVPFKDMRAEHIVPAVREALEQAERDLEALVSDRSERSYANTVQALDDLEERLDRVVTFAAHLSAVKDIPEIRQAYNEVLPEFSGFYAKLPLHDGLWKALQSYAKTAEARLLTGVRKRHLEKLLREFRRAGADLPGETKTRVEALRVDLSKLQRKFGENVLDATNAFEMILEEKDLVGLPESAVKAAKESAEAKGRDGYRFTLQFPSMYPFLQYSERRDLRKKMHEAYTSRAAEDNAPLIIDILEKRKKLAGLLGFKDFADYKVAENMVKTGGRALGFVDDLTERTAPFWRKEIDLLSDFAEKELDLDELESWDVTFAVEKLRKAKYELDAEELRPYFPVEQVLSGLFEIAERVFGISVRERVNDQVWAEAVKFYDIHDEDGTHLGSFYADWFPREEKRGGAWMNSFITGGPGPNGFKPNLGSIAGNFTPPQSDRPALLTHMEVQTVFHEFGHLLHHCLSKVEIPSRAGVRVAMDWVELPSQFMENWTWEREALDLFARHYETGEPIPDALFEKMIAARTFMAAHMQIRQLSFGKVDLELHKHFDPSGDDDVIGYAQRTMEPYSIRPEFAHNAFIASFSHIFAGGYAAGYYSYKWSEVLDADAFSRFKREGIFNRDTGQAYLDSILSCGDSEDPEQQFRNFMGRDPDVNALIERNILGGSV